MTRPKSSTAVVEQTAETSSMSWSTATVRRNARQDRGVRRDHTCRGAEEAAEHVEERRLAGPVAPDQATHAGWQLKRDPVQRRDAAERNCQLTDPQHGPSPSAGLGG